MANPKPIITQDSEGMIVSADWIDPTGATPALEAPIGEGAGAIVMEESTSTALRIAVNGNGCVPETRVSVISSTPVLRLRLSLGEGQPADPNLQCVDILTTHAFLLRLTEPVDPAQVELEVVDETGR